MKVISLDLMESCAQLGLQIHLDKTKMLRNHFAGASATNQKLSVSRVDVEVLLATCSTSQSNFRLVRACSSEEAVRL